MQLRSVFLWLVLLAAYDFLFWHEAPGINLLLFSMLIMIVLFLKYPESLPVYQLRQKTRKQQITLLLAAGVIVSGITVMWYGTRWNAFANIFALAIFAAAIRMRELHSIYFLMLQAIVDCCFIFVAANQRINKLSSNNNRLKKVFSFIKIAVVPVLVAGVFLGLYSWGSPFFAGQVGVFFESIGDLFSNFSFAHFLFIISGIIVLAVLLWQTGVKFFIERDAAPENLIRKRIKKDFRFPMNGLRKEMKAGIVLLVLLNLLLLGVNVMDVRNVWIDFTVPEHFSLKNFVHQGTWVLIACILLSIIVILVLFRRNQHFYKENKWMRLFAIVWIMQNIFLALSVFMRNKYYIGYHGLAYGRIAIIAFLALVICGLITLIIKIRKNKSALFLLRVNAFAVYVLILGTSLFNWDLLIVNYNLHHTNPGQIDVDFYLTVSGDALAQVWKEKELVHQQIEQHKLNAVSWISYTDYEKFHADLDAKIYSYKNDPGDWPSFNFSNLHLRYLNMSP